MGTPGGGGSLLACDGNDHRIKPSAPEKQEKCLLLRSALFWARRGFGIFPVEPKGKRPIGRLAPHGFKSASSDSARIKLWWTQQPDANIGLAISEGMFVIDIDSDEACWAWIGLCERHGKYGPTLTIKTGRGRHIYFKSSSKIKNSHGQIAEGIDVRGPGSCVIAPPSVHPTGQIYALENRNALEVAEAPQWIVDLAKSKEPAPIRPSVPIRPRSDYSRPYVLAVVEKELKAVMNAREGSRNNTLHLAAVSLGTLLWCLGHRRRSAIA
jgi:Bifunctional DNA primase/polymerase, N-terminal